MEEIDIPMPEKYFIQSEMIDCTYQVRELEADGKFDEAEKTDVRTERTNFARRTLTTMGREQKLTYRNLINGTVGVAIGVTDKEIVISTIEYIKYGIACTIADTVKGDDTRPRPMRLHEIKRLLEQKMPLEEIIETFVCIDEFKRPPDLDLK